MSQIRTAIELLAKILRENGTLQIKAETFRAAKFNTNEAVAPLWNLLFDLIYYCHYNHIDDVTTQMYNQLLSEEVVMYVKGELERFGYATSDFNELPNDMSSGSRELLLACAWLIGHEHIIERFIQHSTSLLDDDTAALYQEGLARELSVSQQDSLIEKLQQLIYFNNKLRFGLRTLYTFQCQRAVLKHKIHECTSGQHLTSTKHHLSMLEVYLIRHPDTMKTTIAVLEKDNNRLRNLLTWKHHEGTFWKWMESVLVSKSDSSSSASTHTESRHSLDKLNILRQHHDCLHSSILKFESVVEHLERMCSEKICDVSEADLNVVLTNINTELLIHKHNIMSTCLRNNIILPPLVQYKQGYMSESRCVFDKLASSNSSYNKNTTTMSLLADYEDIDNELNRLVLSVTALEKQFNNKQTLLMSQMSTLTNKLYSAVCIPPLQRQH